MSRPDVGAPWALGVSQARREIGQGRLSPATLLEACLERVRALDGTLAAWAALDEAGARAVAREREAEARHGRLRGPLHGIPVGVKDVIDVAGLVTAAGARAFAHRGPGQDATAVARLRAAGAVILGKTATTEFAFRDPSAARNPWNPAHTPGGSSSGSGAAVAARMVPLALGTQTVGSVLRPAAYCGVVGLKPTHGLVPTDGVVPLAWSLDHVGVLVRSVDDAALALEVLAGIRLDPAPGGPPRLALAPELVARAEPGVAHRLQAAVEALARGGATVTEVRLPAAFADVHEAGQLVLECEAAAFHAPTFAQHREEYGPALRGMLESGLARPATAYVLANRARWRFREAVMPLLAAHDALLSPTAPGPAPAGLAWTGDASLCAPWSFAGSPSLTLPTVVGPGGLPEALQLTAPAGAEAALLRAAAWCERVLGFSAVSPA